MLPATIGLCVSACAFGFNRNIYLSGAPASGASQGGSSQEIVVLKQIEQTLVKINAEQKSQSQAISQLKKTQSQDMSSLRKQIKDYDFSSQINAFSIAKNANALSSSHWDNLNVIQMPSSISSLMPQTNTPFNWSGGSGLLEQSGSKNYIKDVNSFINAINAHYETPRLLSDISSSLNGLTLGGSTTSVSALMQKQYAAQSIGDMLQSQAIISQQEANDINLQKLRQLSYINQELVKFEVLLPKPKKS